MKCLRRNMREFEYLGYTGLESDLDDNGLHTGIFKPQYDDPVTYRGNISTPSGGVSQAFDGLETRYTHILIMDDPDVGINEYGKIRYKGKLYTVTAVRPSLNTVSIALLEDTIDHGDQLNGDDD